jgi:hypothetical protein
MSRVFRVVILAPAALIHIYPARGTLPVAVNPNQWCQPAAVDASALLIGFVDFGFLFIQLL